MTKLELEESNKLVKEEKRLLGEAIDAKEIEIINLNKKYEDFDLTVAKLKKAEGDLKVVSDHNKLVVDKYNNLVRLFTRLETANTAYLKNVQGATEGASELRALMMKEASVLLGGK